MDAHQGYKSFICKDTSTTDLKFAKFGSGHGGAEPEVVKFPGACHKRFPGLMQAEKFMADWAEMYSFVSKELTKQEISQGSASLRMNGRPIKIIREPEKIIVEESLEYMLSEMRI